MTTPSASPAEQVEQLWQDLTQEAQTTPAGRACLAAVVHLTNRTWQPTRPQNRDPVEGLARDTAWFIMALTAYDMLHLTGAYSHVAAASTDTCRADLDVIEAWLTGPSDLPGFSDMTTAETWGVSDDFDNQDLDRSSVMATLLDQAQKAHLFGIPGHDIKLRTVRDGDDDEYLIQLITPAGASFAYSDLTADHLIDDGTYGVQAAVSLLANTALYVDVLLNQQARIAAAGWTERLPTLDQTHSVVVSAESATESGRSARPFAPLTLTPTPVPVGDSPATPQPPTSPTRHR